MYRYFAILVFLAGLVYSAASQSAPPDMVVKHTDTGYSPALRPYMTDILELLMDSTRLEYGPYQVKNSKVPLSSERAKVETEKGHLINVLFASRWTVNDGAPSSVAEYNLPIFNDLLGLRALLAKKGTIENKVNRLSDLKRLRAGQGEYWEDVTILRHNHLPVTEAHVFDALFPMLHRGRFDYLPLSVLEAEMALAETSARFNNLYILPNTYIFYPLDFHLYVNKGEGRLAARFKLALEKVTTKQLADLFYKHFPKLMFLTQKAKQTNKNKLFMAYNPNISRKKNNAITQRFLDNYGDFFTALE